MHPRTLAQISALTRDTLWKMADDAIEDAVGRVADLTRDYLREASAESSAEY